LSVPTATAVYVNTTPSSAGIERPDAAATAPVATLIEQEQATAPPVLKSAAVNVSPDSDRPVETLSL
jgi:hypothetical protein